MGYRLCLPTPSKYRVWCVLQSWLKDAGNTFSGINGSFSAGYAVLTASLLAAGIGYIVAPGLTLQGVSSHYCCFWTL
jgi:hypothetical protein